MDRKTELFAHGWQQLQDDELFTTYAVMRMQCSPEVGRAMERFISRAMLIAYYYAHDEFMQEIEHIMAQIKSGDFHNQDVTPESDSS